MRDISRIEAVEVIFIIYGFGFAIEEAASIKERGLDTYTSQIWNMLDLGFLCKPFPLQRSSRSAAIDIHGELGTFFIYFALRMVGLAHHSTSLSVLAFDILAVGHFVMSTEDISQAYSAFARSAPASCSRVCAACFSPTAWS